VPDSSAESAISLTRVVLPTVSPCPVGALPSGKHSRLDAEKSAAELTLGSEIQELTPEEERWFAATSARLASLARSSGVPQPDSEDVAQETLFAAIMQIRAKRFRGESSIDGWLNGILRHKVARYWRDQRPQHSNTVPLEEAAPGERELCTHSTKLGFQSVELGYVLDQAIASLSTRKIEIVLLNCLDGLSTSEIAVRVKRSPGRVGAMLAEGKSQIRNCMGVRRSRHRASMAKVLNRS
jgi:RNA polymerase sigma factor (sigma-70 family)